MTISALIAYAVGAFLGSYGMADGGPPQFVAGATNYFVPFVAVLIINLIRVNHKLAKRAKAIEDG